MVLDWNKSKMGSLTMVRLGGAAITLNHIGVFIVGGGFTNNKRTSNFLAAGTMQWQEGPALPVGMLGPCLVSITPTSFLSISKESGITTILEFDAAIAGPTNNDGWRDAERWPRLKINRSKPGCAKVGQKVIIAGGEVTSVGRQSTTEVLDLVNRRITPGEEMARPRSYFHLATIIDGGEDKLFAIGGMTEPYPIRLNTVEEWVEESSTWKAADNLVEKRNSFSIVAVPKELLCPT